MTPIGNRLYRQASADQEDAASIEAQMARIEDDIRKLKINFDVYLNHGAKRPPLEERARLESKIKRISDERSLTFAQRYQFNTMVARYMSYRELWRRLLKAKGEEIA